MAAEFVHQILSGVSRCNAIRSRLLMRQTCPNILVYHRILKDASNGSDARPNSAIEVSVSRFEQHLELIRSRYRARTMDELINAVQQAEGDPTVAVTFDDGYQDNIEVVLPLLEKYQIPATFYIMTRLPEGLCSMWWYEIWELIKNRMLMEFRWKSRPYSWKIADAEGKRRCYEELRELFVAADSFARQEELLELVRAGESERDYDHFCLNWSDIRRLAEHPLATIGAHTHHHLRLAGLAESEVIDELIRSKRLIEKHIGREVRHLAFPYGTGRDVGVREVLLAEKCGFCSAVMTEEVEFARGRRTFALPRHTVVESHSAAHLNSKLAGWSELYHHYWHALPPAASRTSRKMER